MKIVFYNGGTIGKLTFTVTSPKTQVERLVWLSDGTPVPKDVALVEDFPQPIFDDRLCCYIPPVPCNEATCSLPLLWDSTYVMFMVLTFGVNLGVELEYLKINGDTVLSNEEFYMEDTEILIDTVDGVSIYVNLFNWIQPLVSPWLQLELSAIENEFGDPIDITTITRRECDVQSFEMKLVPIPRDGVGFDSFVINENGYVSVTSGNWEDESILNYIKGTKNCL